MATLLIPFPQFLTPGTRLREDVYRALNLHLEKFAGGWEQGLSGEDIAVVREAEWTWGRGVLPWSPIHIWDSKGAGVV